MSRTAICAALGLALAVFVSHKVVQAAPIVASDACRTVHLHPVYDSNPSGPNAAWSKATPSGQISLSITNPAAYERFEEGKDYMVTFTPAA